MCGQVLSIEDLKKRSPVCEFFIQLVAKCIDRGAVHPRLDLLACSVAQNADLSAQMAEELSNLLQVSLFTGTIVFRNLIDYFNLLPTSMQLVLVAKLSLIFIV